MENWAKEIFILILDYISLFSIFLMCLVFYEKYKINRYKENLGFIDIMNCCAVTIISYDVALMIKIYIESKI